MVSTCETEPLGWTFRCGEGELLKAVAEVPFQRQVNKETTLKLNGSLYLATAAHLRKERNWL